MTGLHLVASSDNTGAIAFYPRVGFEPLPSHEGVQAFGRALLTLTRRTSPAGVSSTPSAPRPGPRSLPPMDDLSAPTGREPALAARAARDGTAPLARSCSARRATSAGGSCRG